MLGKPALLTEWELDHGIHGTTVSAFLVSSKLVIRELATECVSASQPALSKQGAY